MKNLTIIGHYCATGGISIHVRRLNELLSDSFNTTIIDESRLKDSDGKIFNLRNKNILGYVKIMMKSDIIHVHSSVPILRFIHVFIGFISFKRVILTVHSLSTVKTKKGLFFLKLTARLSKRLIVVSKEIHEKLSLKKAVIIPAFIPPNIANESELPPEISSLISKVKSDQKRLLIGNAYRLNLHKNEDLYGLDLIVEVAKKAKKENLNIFFLFVLTSLEVNKDVFEKYLDIIEQNKLESHIFIHTQPLSFVKLIVAAEIVLRPTNTDGDAITIREAIHLGKKVIASDVVIRPQETVLFKNRDADDFYAKIKEVLIDSSIPITTKNDDFLEIYLSVFLN